MEPNRSSGLDPEQTPGEHEQDNQLTAPVPEAEDVEGQLGPDELPDPEEVARNLEAKRHP